MKPPTTIGAGSVILGILLLSLPGFGQVIIEGTRFGVDYSNRDGRIEVASPSSYGETIIVPGPVTIDPGIRTNSTTRRNTDISRLVPYRPRTSGLVAPQRAVHVIDVNKIQTVARLERELEVIKTTRTAWMAFEADRLFASRQSSLGRSTRALLDKVIQYMALTNGKGIKISYDYVSKGDSAEMGMARANSMVSYLSAKTGLSPGWFTVATPEPVKPTPVSYGNPSRPYESVVNIRIQR